MHNNAFILGTVSAVIQGETKGQSPKPLLTIVIETPPNDRGYSDTVALQTTKPEKFGAVAKGQQVAATYRGKSRAWQDKWFHDLMLLELQVLSGSAAKRQAAPVEDDYALAPDEMPF